MGDNMSNKKSVFLKAMLNSMFTNVFVATGLLLVVFVTPSVFAGTKDLGRGFTDHGVIAPFVNPRGIIATDDGNSQNIVLAWLRDWRGIYGLLMIDAETGQNTQEIPTPVSGYDGFASILSSDNKLYAHFESRFMEFDPAQGAFTFSQTTSTRTGWSSDMATSMTEDDNGNIWSVTFPLCSLVKYNPATSSFTNYGSVHYESWNQYPRAIAADATGWIYFGTGVTESQIVAFNPQTSSSTEMIPKQDEVYGDGYVYRNVNGKVYGYVTPGEWYEFYNGTGTYIGAHTENPKSIIAGNQNLFHADFPDGKKLEACDMIEKVIKVKNLSTGTTETIDFDYSCEGAYVMGVAVAQDNTICGGAAFPMHFCSYNPKKDLADEWIDSAVNDQWNAITQQGNSFFAATYPAGGLVEWDTTKQWELNTNPLSLVTAYPAIARPGELLALSDGKTLVMGGRPAFGYTGGGLLFWDRDTKTSTLLYDSSVVTYQSTMSLVELADGTLLGGTTTTPGDGGIKLATEAELYIMNVATKQVVWHDAVISGAQQYLDMISGPGGLVFGFADLKYFFVFNPATRTVVYQYNTENDVNLGETIWHQGSRVFTVGSDGQIYILFKKGVAYLNPTTYEIKMLADSPTEISAGGDVLNGRIYFTANGGGHLYSYLVDTQGSWTFDEDSGLTAGDSSPYENDGSLENMSSSTCWVLGQVGSALKFDGVNDYVDCGNAAGMNPSSAITVEAWVKLEDKTSFQQIVHRGNSFSSGTGQGPYSMGIYNNRIYWDIADGTTRSSFAFDISSLSTNTWYHFVGIFDGTSQDFYINGFKYSHTSTVSSMRTDTNPVRIGGSTFNFKGSIDEVKIYNRALSGDEIYERYLAGSICGSWEFNEDTGLTAMDSSSHENDGLLKNMVSDTCWVLGQVGTALEFDGTDDYVDCGNSADLNPASAITVEAWVMMDDKTSFQQIVHRGSSFAADINQGPYTMGIYNNRIYWDIADGTTRSSFALSISSLSTGAWYHFAGIFDGTNQDFYINGVKYPHTSTVSSMRTDTNPVLIGGSTFNFNGLIDQVRIYNRALSQDEIALNYELDNQCPIVEINSTDQNILLSETATLDATVSDDGQPTGTVTVTWSKVSGTGNVTFGNANTEDTTASFDAAGTYVLKLTASDGAREASANITVYCKVPVLQLKMDDNAANSIVSESSGRGDSASFSDASGNPNTSAHSVTGQVNTALNFDGVDDYIDGGNSAAMNPLSEITVEAWVKLEDKTSFQEIVHRGNSFSSGTGQGPYSMAIYSNRIYWDIGDGVVRSSFAFDISSLSTNTWYHFVGIFDGTNQDFYINGVKYSHTSTVSYMRADANPVLIGGSTFKFKGSIDEVKIYDRALSSSDIYQNYQEGL
jgi:hypothetical protein